MATLVLGAVGSVLGPIGGAIGAFVGRTIDQSIFGGGGAEGPRLKELAVSGSSYGTPIARHYGVMRAPGTIVWSTDLIEHESREGGGKGKPKTTSFSYSVSFAVSLSSRPIDRIGRIWADGNLLRGAAGDLKTGGELRIYRGHGDQACDPLLKAKLGKQCPAFRGCAYVVFEQLDLTEFGNRIPALSFEIFAGEGPVFVETMIREDVGDVAASLVVPQIRGFSYDGGAVRNVLALVDGLRPVSPRLGGKNLSIGQPETLAGNAPVLPPAASWDDGEFGAQSGAAHLRKSTRNAAFYALRYYDIARDYQPGLQRADGYASDQRVFDFPGALQAADALSLVRDARQRGNLDGESLLWRCAALDPEIGPGSLVKVPGEHGWWRVVVWEWCEKGVELELTRHRTIPQVAAVAHAGSVWSAPDQQPAAIDLQAFEVPWDGLGSSGERCIFAAVTVGEGRWTGTSLYAVQDDILIDTEQFLTGRAATGELAETLPGSTCLRLEGAASITVRLKSGKPDEGQCSATGLAQGRNRVLVGSEVLQFLNAQPVDDTHWRLSGLLRGRGGTEPFATAHPAGTPVVMLDNRITEISQRAVSMVSDEGFAALGPADQPAVRARVENAGFSLTPPSPVHARATIGEDGSVLLHWTRRARGGWQWRDGVDQALTEETELYEIGSGPPSSPLFLRQVATNSLRLQASDYAHLGEANGTRFWVRQVGTFARSARAWLIPEETPSV